MDCHILHETLLFHVDMVGGISINTQLSFIRTHIFGVDMATSIAGIGFWAEAALFMPESDVIMV
ncbi:MAG: hypothetical protein MZV70_36680 [Desulfobacterales bacterium]|nr:hypothetical protein [Desulfobacterales bacterium]